MAISKGQHVAMPENGMPHLTLRTDSITLHNGSEKDGTPVHRVPRAGQSLILGEVESPSSHQKKPSASSISSISSAGSKTAAFFNAPSAENTVRPAASTSSSSLHSNPYSSPHKQSIDRPFVGHGEAMQTSESDDGSGMLPTSSSTGLSLLTLQGAQGLTSNESINELNRANSVNSQGGGRRGWMDFEKRPIMALPSPNVFHDAPLGGKEGEEGYGFPSTQVEVEEGGRQGADMEDLASERGGTPVRRARSASKPSYVQHRKNKLSEAEEEMAESPKTLNFFGSAWPANTLASAKEGKAANFTSGSPMMPSRTTSETHSLYAPSRFPSASALHPRPERLSMDLHEDANLKNVSSGERVFSDLQVPHNTPGRIIYGTQPSVIPAAFISPPSPDPSDLSASLAQHENATATPRSHVSRHTHGPSENVTNSSILPHADLLHLPDRGASTFDKQSQRDIDTMANTGHPSSSSDTGQRLGEESEDESTNRVGPYTVESVLGVGAFSRVVLAKRVRGRPTTAESQAQKESKGLVALKMLEKEPCRQNERMRVSWVREVEVLKHIVHPFIVRFLSSFSTDKHHVLVLENVEGGELFEFLAHEQAELAQREWLVRRIFGELANAVGWMHSIHLVHRDIKLENIILARHLRHLRPLTPNSLSNEPIVKLTDFGLSRFVDPSSPLLETRCGSEEYAAPELILGKRYDGRQTDVWAMGVVLYALLSGSLPFLSDMTGSVPGQGMTNAREGAPQHQNDAKARKAHLLRIAKGDLRWPAQANDAALDTTDVNVCPAQHRLITPPARLLVAKLLRRDAAKRAQAWDVWDESWMLYGSFKGQETSANGQVFVSPLDPRSPEGQAWLGAQARVRAGAPDVVRDD